MFSHVHIRLVPGNSPTAYFNLIYNLHTSDYLQERGAIQRSEFFFVINTLGEINILRNADFQTRPRIIFITEELARDSGCEEGYGGKGEYG